MTNIYLHAVTWSTDTAGVSPYRNMRTEVFFRGCGRAMANNPCKGCFNRELWYQKETDITHSVESIAAQIIEKAPNKYVTIGGGEPTDQLDGLVELTRLLKEAGFHIMVYTWKDLSAMLNSDSTERDGFIELLNNIDMVVDGEFQMDKRLYRPKEQDGFFSSIGSANQTIWDVRTLKRSKGEFLSGYYMGEVMGMSLDPQDDLIFHMKERKEPRSIYLQTKEEIA